MRRLLTATRGRYISCHTEWSVFCVHDGTSKVFAAIDRERPRTKHGQDTALCGWGTSRTWGMDNWIGCVKAGIYRNFCACPASFFFRILQRDVQIYPLSLDVVVAWIWCIVVDTRRSRDPHKAACLLHKVLVCTVHNVYCLNLNFYPRGNLLFVFFHALCLRDVNTCSSLHGGGGRSVLSYYPYRHTVIRSLCRLGMFLLLRSASAVLGGRRSTDASAGIYLYR